MTLFGKIVDKAIIPFIGKPDNYTKLATIIVEIISVFGLSVILDFMYNYLMIIVSQKTLKDIRDDMFVHMQKLPIRYFDANSHGDIMSKYTNDTDTLRQMISSGIPNIISSFAIIISVLIFMIMKSFLLTMLVIIFVIFMLFITKKLAGLSSKYFVNHQQTLGELNGYIEEIYSGHNVVKSYNATNEAQEQFEILNKKLYETKSKSIFLSGTMQPLMNFIGNLGYVAVCIVGALLTMNNYISFGVIVAFMIYVRLFTNPLSQIAQAMTNLQSTAAASERVFEFIDEEEMVNQKKIKKVQFLILILFMD